MEIILNLDDINCSEANLKDYYDLFPYFKDIRGSAGDEHYRLLNYLTRQFSKSTIIDIGTHYGASAIALCSPSNRVISFDIISKVSDKILERAASLNIEFVLADLIYNEDARTNYENLLLTSPLIFIDVDPHNGEMESILYNYFQEKEYQGLLIFDDIHKFPGMRKFWSSIPEVKKYDLTKYGHFSGTGLVTFNQNYSIKLT